MKKIISLALAVMMIATMSVTAFAATIENGTGTVEVTYGVSESYTVIIPADITLTANQESDMEISASDVVIPYGNELTVSISSTNYTDSKWYLVEAANTANKLEYSVKNGENAVASGDTILTVAAGTAENQTVNLTTKLVGTATHSGTYKDTLTFSVSVASSSGGTTETWTTVTDESGLKTALEAGGKVKLGADIEMTNYIEICTQSDSDLVIVLDLNGYAITSSKVSGELLFFINDRKCNLKVTIKDTSAKQTGKIAATATATDTGIAVVCGGGTEITVEGGTISGSCALNLLGSAKAVINAGTLCSNDADNAALYFGSLSSSAVINGGTIENTAGGKAIHTGADTQTLKITGGKITGKIYVYSDSPASITITGGTYSLDPTELVDTENYVVTSNTTDNTWTVSTKTSD